MIVRKFSSPPLPLKLHYFYTIASLRHLRLFALSELRTANFGSPALRFCGSSSAPSFIKIETGGLLQLLRFLPQLLTLHSSLFTGEAWHPSPVTRSGSPASLPPPQQTKERPHPATPSHVLFEYICVRSGIYQGQRENIIFNEIYQ